MANTNPNNASSDIKFKEPKNPTDPIVVFDPEFEVSNIILPFDGYSDGNKPTDVNENYLNNEAIKTPLIKLNNKVIFGDRIFSMKLYIKDFLPTIELIIDDLDKNIQGTDIPGMNNVITVVMISPIDGVNKKVTLDFYITKCTFNDDNTITYLGELKINGLKQKKYTQVGDKELNTYEFLETIAKELKLGYATSDKCKDIDDKKWRQIYSETYKDFIIQELSHAGLDEESIMDAWIDNFGYLVLVNVSWIMSEAVDYDQLSTPVITGNLTSLPKDAVPEPQPLETYRVISNSKESATSQNLYFDEYHSNVDTSKIMNKGTSNKYYYLSSPCDENLIKLESIEIVDASVDGVEGQDEYIYENIEFIGTHQSDDEEGVCEIFQEQIVTNYFNKLYYKTLKVRLDNANYSLQRGMLLGVIVEEYTPRNKEFIMNNTDNVSASEKTDETSSPQLDATDLEKKIDENNGAINPGLTGIYYIKDILFEYNGSNPNVYQTLTLVKKGASNNLNNKYTESHFVE